MQINPYLSFAGECEIAFAFYAQCLGGQVGAIYRYGESPMADHVPAGWSDKVMHGTLTVGDRVIMGGDVAPDQYEAPKGFSLAVQLTSVAEAERVFQELADGGSVFMRLEETFWAARFGMLVDRFGIPWMVNCGAGSQPAE